jgi:hypothetical protein
MRGKSGAYDFCTGGGSPALHFAAFAAYRTPRAQSPIRSAQRARALFHGSPLC